MRASRILLIAAALSSIACDTVVENNTAGSAPSAAAPVFSELNGLNNIAMIFDVSMKQEDVAAAAKEHCAGKQVCLVLGWTEQSSAATAMPMTDGEVAAQAFSYSVNRNTGFEQVLWDCSRFQQADTSECLAKA